MNGRDYENEGMTGPGVQATVLAVTAVSLLLTGCVSSSKSEMTTLENPRRAVYLEQIPDQGLPAAHPISIDPALLARVLRGVQVRSEQTSAQTLVSQKPAPVQVFTEEDVQFLAPAIAKALDRATSDQRVAFRLVHPVPTMPHPEGRGAGAGSETTSGMLYAYGLSLYLTLTEYRHTPERPDPSTLTVTFVPEAAGRSDREQPGNVPADPLPATLVIDYQLLARIPFRPSQPVQASPEGALASTMGAPTSPVAAATATAPTGQFVEAQVPGEDVRALKDLVIKKDMELEALKKELKSVRRQLAERDAQIESLKRKGKAPF